MWNFPWWREVRVAELLGQVTERFVTSANLCKVKDIEEMSSMQVLSCILDEVDDLWINDKQGRSLHARSYKHRKVELILLQIGLYAVLLSLSSTNPGSAISESAFGALVSILAFCCLAAMRFDALSICFCCLAFSFVCLPKLYMDLPIFSSYFLHLYAHDWWKAQYMC